MIYILLLWILIRMEKSVMHYIFQKWAVGHMIVCVDSGELAPIDFLTSYLSLTSAGGDLCATNRDVIQSQC